VTAEGDGGLAVIDIHTVWVARDTGARDEWCGRVCKVYALCADGWQTTMHTGVLDYSVIR
jgi:hypothetical protein